MDNLQFRLRHVPVLKNPYPAASYEAFPDSPYEAFRLWLDEAIEAGIPEPHVMTLSTVDEHGHADARNLILKNVDTRGWHFATKRGSPKDQQIHCNSRVALTFYWVGLGRQVRVRGEAVALSQEECLKDFLARPADSRLAAVASKQSLPGFDRETMLARLAGLQRVHSDGGEQGGHCWIVYAVAPASVEFWQGRGDRLHDRLRYERVPSSDDRWEKALLWP